MTENRTWKNRVQYLCAAAVFCMVAAALLVLRPWMFLPTGQATARLDSLAQNLWPYLAAVAVVLGVVGYIASRIEDKRRRAQGKYVEY